MYILASGGILLILIITIAIVVAVTLAMYLKLRRCKASGESAKERIGTIDGLGDHVAQKASGGNYSAVENNMNLEDTIEVTQNEAYVCTTGVVTQTSEAHQLPASGSVESNFEYYYC